MFDFMKLSRQDRDLRIKEKQLEIRQRENALKLVETALEARNTVVDDDLVGGNWFLLGSRDNPLDETQLRNMQESAYKLYHNNPHARAIIRNLVKFILGKGPQVIPDDKNQKVKDAWAEFKRQNNFNIREKEIGVRVFRDGEVFLRLFRNKGNGDVKIRFIRSTSIADPINIKHKPKSLSFGIETDPDDVEQPLYYYQVDGNNNLVAKIPAED